MTFLQHTETFRVWGCDSAPSPFRDVHLGPSHSVDIAFLRPRWSEGDLPKVVDRIGPRNCGG